MKKWSNMARRLPNLIMEMNRKEHWEKVYNSRELEKVGWYQKKPTTSLKFIEKINSRKDDKIIDVGGGAYFLVDNLLEMSYTDITVLDISKSALIRAQERLDGKAKFVKWIIEDITAFNPEQKYTIWHDRAVFHFLTERFDIQRYVELISKNVIKGGHFILGTFSVDGPKKCSGLDIMQYSEEKVKETFKDSFEFNESLRVDHFTPSGIKQNFLFSHFVHK